MALYYQDIRALVKTMVYIRDQLSTMRHLMGLLTHLLKLSSEHICKKSRQVSALGPGLNPGL